MEQFAIYIILFGIIVIVGQVFDKTTIPLSLILVIVGMILSMVPNFPTVTLNPDVVLDIFLPILIYQASSFSSWKEYKKNFRPITLLSIGHVVFITCIVAFIIHALKPDLGWPLSFVLGAVISPPDDVAIISIVEKVHMPERVVTILEGEGMFNDAAALIIFRFALAAIVTQQFVFTQAVSAFFLIVIGETLYGFLSGYIIGEIRLRIKNTQLQVILSLLTPFIAYFPCVMMGGSGVIATAIVGFIIGNHYATRFTPEYRILAFTLWPTVAFTVQSIVFLLVGIDMNNIVNSISVIPIQTLLLYSSSVILTVIIGRFIWVYLFVLFLPRLLFPSIKKKDPYPPWQAPFIISWAGMRGGISLAAALAVPTLPLLSAGANPKNLLIFLVFCVIAVTLVLQGLTLPWLIKKIGIQKMAIDEHYNQHIVELTARYKVVKAALRWLKKYLEEVKDNPDLYEQVKLFIREYKMLRTKLKERIKSHDGESLEHDEMAEVQEELFVLSQIVEIEKEELMRMWHNDEINLAVRNKILQILDHKVKHLV